MTCDTLSSPKTPPLPEGMKQIRISHAMREALVASLTARELDESPLRRWRNTECGEIATLLRPLPPYRVTLKAYGCALGDLAFGPGGLLVSERFRNAWEGANLRGLEFTPLERIRVRPARLGKKTPTQFHTVPQLHGTQVDVDRSLIEYDRPITCNKCKSGGGETVRGFVIDESS